MRKAGVRSIELCKNAPSRARFEVCNPQRIAESKGNLSGEGLFFAKDLSLRVDTVVEVL